MSENEQNDTAEKESEGSLLVATFALGDGTFGVNTEHVQEVVKNGDITPVHHAPPSVPARRSCVR